MDYGYPLSICSPESAIPERFLHCFRRILNCENIQLRTMAERESSGSLPKRKSSRMGMSCAEFFLIFAFGLFAAIALFYAVQFVIVGYFCSCQ